MNRKDYRIVDIDYFNKDAVLEVYEYRIYFQFYGEEPTLEDVRKDLIKYPGGMQTYTESVLKMLEGCE